MNMNHINGRLHQVMVALLAMVACLLTACDKDETTYMDQPFVRIATEQGTSSVVVKTDVKNINTYNVILSAPRQTDNLTVDYEVTVGDGLQAGVDFEMVTTGNSLLFLPGIFDMPIRIQWLPHKVDPTKDNTIRIRLTGNSKNYNLGMPGPDHLQSELVIEKQN